MMMNFMQAGLINYEGALKPVGFSFDAAPPTDPGLPTGAVSRFEAENMTLVNAAVQGLQPASNGQCIRMTSSTVFGSAAFVYSADPAGEYVDVEWRYYDENDGLSPYEAYIDGVLVDSWIANEDTGTHATNEVSARTRIVADFTLLTGDTTVEIRSKINAGENGRVDYAEIRRYVL